MDFSIHQSYEFSRTYHLGHTTFSEGDSADGFDWGIRRWLFNVEKVLRPTTVKVKKSGGKSRAKSDS